MIWRSNRSVSADPRSRHVALSAWASATFAALLTCAAATATVLADGASSTDRVTAPAPARERVAATLDARVRLLSKELDLDARQQEQLRGILERQRAGVRKVWSDSTLLPGERGPATRAVSEHTADQIRAILSETQRKKYNPPPPTLTETGAGGGQVQVWMDKMQPSRPGTGH